MAGVEQLVRLAHARIRGAADDEAVTALLRFGQAEARTPAATDLVRLAMARMQLQRLAADQPALQAQLEQGAGGGQLEILLQLQRRRCRPAAVGIAAQRGLQVVRAGARGAGSRSGTGRRCQRLRFDGIERVFERRGAIETHAEAEVAGIVDAAEPQLDAARIARRQRRDRALQRLLLQRLDHGRVVRRLHAGASQDGQQGGGDSLHSIRASEFRCAG